MEFLGHVLSKDGISKSPEFIKKVSKFPKPNNVNELRSYLGLVNFQRKFGDKFAEIAKPLSEITGGEKKEKIEWNEEREKAFEQLKEEVKKEVTLSYPDYSSKADLMELFVDASGTGAGACLRQRQEGEYRTIGYSSISFSQSQQNYSTIERELTAIRWACENFQTVCVWSVSYTHLTLPTNREV